MTLLAKTSQDMPAGKVLGFLIIDAARLLRAAFEHRIAEAGLGLTAGEARALINIANHQGHRQLDIAASMGVEPMTLCTYLDKLQSLGLIERQKCKVDRRAKRIVLTQKSDQLIKRIRSEFQGIIGQATDGMPQQDMQALEMSLSAFNRNLQEFLPSAPPVDDAR